MSHISKRSKVHRVMHNMSFKPLFRSKLRQHSDVPRKASFANGFAILSQTKPYTSRRLTKCYASLHVD
jgi:hypothetical protein